MINQTNAELPEGVALNPQIFNTHKSDYGNPSLFLGELPGLFDTVHRRHPKIWSHYKNMKSLDWDELEFDFSVCNLEFKTRPASITDRMIKTLAWQWEADSVAARTLLPLMAPFITAPELQAAYGRVTDNEVIHAATYSEIVRLSFDDPSQVLKEVLEVKEAMARLETVSQVLGELYTASHEYALGMRSGDQETYNIIFKALAAFLALERIQFMASFAVTFAIGEVGAFMPIAKAVQKICQDEFEVHVGLGKDVIAHELSTERGKRAYVETLPAIARMLKEVVESELRWVDMLLGQGEPLVGLTAPLLKQWVLYSAADVYRVFDIPLPTEYKFPRDNPLPYMENWIDISKTQPAPQEQQNGQYKVNVLVRNDDNLTFEDIGL